jgi:hypothetical protein
MPGLVPGIFISGRFALGMRNAGYLFLVMAVPGLDPGTGPGHPALESIALLASGSLAQGR